MWEKRDIFSGRKNFELAPALHKDNYDLNGLKKVHFVPQYLFLEIDGELVMDFVGRYENVKADFQYVCNALGQKFALPHHRKSNGQRETARRGPYQEYYTTETREMVGDIHAKDVALFQYQF